MYKARIITIGLLASLAIGLLIGSCIGQESNTMIMDNMTQASEISMIYSPVNYCEECLKNCSEQGYTESELGIYANPEENLNRVEASPEFLQLKSQMISTEPIEILKANNLTLYVYALNPTSRSVHESTILHRSVIFASDERGNVVSGIILTPDINNRRYDIKNIRNPEFNRQIGFSKDMIDELQYSEDIRESRSNISAQSRGPCDWYCYPIPHPQWFDQTGFEECTLACDVIPSPAGKVACAGVCWAMNYYPAWTDCDWRWQCGLP